MDYFLQQLDFEVELAFVIGKAGKKIKVRASDSCYSMKEQQWASLLTSTPVSSNGLSPLSPHSML